MNQLSNSLSRRSTFFFLFYYHQIILKKKNASEVLERQTAVKYKEIDQIEKERTKI